MLLSREALLHILCSCDTFINLPDWISILASSASYHSSEVNIRLPHFLLQLFFISYQLQFTFRQRIQRLVTMLVHAANYYYSRYLVTFRYTGTEERQEVKLTLSC